MIKTKIKKAAAIAALTALIATSLGLAGFATSYATQVGTGSVTADPAFDAVINWDDTFGVAGNATGSVTDIVVQATVVPSLNMEISTGAIDLGNLTANVEATGTLDLEIGTNAASGVSISARSASGGLTNTTDNGIQINSLGTLAESYMFASAINAAEDSSFGTFTQSATLDAEVVDNSSEHPVYTSNKPQAKNNVDDITFTVKATTVDETAAGTYEDKIVFTVTGNF